MVPFVDFKDTTVLDTDPLSDKSFLKTFGFLHLNIFHFQKPRTFIVSSNTVRTCSKKRVGFGNKETTLIYSHYFAVFKEEKKEQKKKRPKMAEEEKSGTRECKK